jgi:hypothetical protein
MLSSLGGIPPGEVAGLSGAQPDQGPTGLSVIVTRCAPDLMWKPVKMWTLCQPRDLLSTWARVEDLKARHHDPN